MQVLSGSRSSGAAGTRLSRATLDAPGSSLPATPVQGLRLVCGQGRVQQRAEAARLAHARTPRRIAEASR
eukprot:5417850-Pyramimonas_sp.AAC.1